MLIPEPVVFEDFDPDAIPKVMAIREKIVEGYKRHPKEIFIAFCIVLMQKVQNDYLKFIEGLDLSENDRIVILKGFLDKVTQWDDVYIAIEIGSAVLDELVVILRESQKKGKKKSLSPKEKEAVRMISKVAERN